MRIKKRLAVGLLAMLFAASLAQAADISSTANGVFNGPATWVGGIVPGPADHVITSHTITISAADVVVSSITIQGGGHINVTSTNTITLTANFFSSGTFTPGTSTVTFQGATPSVIWSSAPAFSFNQLVSSKDANVALIAQVALDINDDFRLFGGTFSAGSFEHRLAGDWIETEGEAVGTISTILTFDGGAPQALNIAAGVGDFAIVIDSGVGTRNLTLSGPMNINGDLKLLSVFAAINVGASGNINLFGNLDKQAGTFSMTLPSTITFRGSAPQTITSASALPQFGNFISSSPVLSILSNIDINGDLEIDAGTLSISSRAITLAGNLRVPPGGTGYTASASVVRSTITLDGTTLQTISLNGNTPLYSLTVANTGSGAALAPGASAFLALNGDFKINSTAVFSGTTTVMDVRGDVDTAGANYTAAFGHKLRLADPLGLGIHDITPGSVFGRDLSVMGGTASIAGVSSITVNGIFDIQPGQVFDGLGDTLRTDGGVTVNSPGLYNTDAGSWVEIIGSIPNANILGQPRNVRINRSSSADQFIILPGTLTVLGDFIFQMGQMNFNIGQKLEVQGNFRQTGVLFAPTDGTVEMSGPSFAEIQMAAGNLQNLIINKPPTGFNVTAKSALSINGNLTLPPSGSNLSSFNASTFTHILKGDFLQSGNLFTHGGSTWSFQGGANQNVQGGLAWNGFEVNSASQVKLLSGFTTVGNSGGSLKVLGGTFDIGFATLQVSSLGAAQITGGTFDVGSGTATFLSGLTVGPAGRLFLPTVTPPSVVKLGAGKKLLVQGKFESFGAGNLLTSDSVGVSSFTFDVAAGTFDVSGLTIQSSDGLIISSNTGIFNANNVSIRSQMGGKPALTISRVAGASTMTFSGWDFDSSVSTNVFALSVPAASTITMVNATGAKAGAAFEFDPNNAVVWGVATAANLVVAAPGESFSASPPGKTGAPVSQLAGGVFQVTVRAVDSGWNLVASATHTVFLEANPTGPAFSGPTPLVSGTTFFLISAPVAAGTFSLTSKASGLPSLVPSASTVTITSGVSDTSVPPSAVTDLSAIPGNLTGDVILNWSGVGFDGNSGNLTGNYRIQFSTYILSWSTAAVDNILTFPVSAVAPGSPMQKDIAGLTVGVTYFFRIWAQDSLGNWSGVSNAAQSFPRSAGFAGAVSGEGMASLAPLTVAAGASNVSATITFTVGGSTISPGGKISVRVPEGWSWPQLSGGGFITAQSTAIPAVDLSSITLNNQQAIIRIQGANALRPADVVRIVYNNGFAQSNAQDGVIWHVYSQNDAVGTLGELLVSPTMNVTVGLASFVTFTNWDMIAVKNNTASPALQIVSVDSTFINEAKVPAGPGLIISLSGTFFSTTTSIYVADPGARFSLSQDFSVLISSVYIPVGQSRSPLFYYRSATAGFNTIQASYTLTSVKDLFRGVQVLSSAAGSFTALSVDAGSPVAGQTIATISPDGDGSQDFAVVTFKSPDLQSSWVVSISSSADFTNPLWRGYGSGDPLRTVAWYGDNNVVWPPAKVSTGTYRVKVALLGDVIQDSTTLSITLTANTLTGRVQNENFSPEAGVRVDAYGPNFATALTNENGEYTLVGVRSGAYSLYFNKFGFAPASLFGVTAPGAASVSTLKKPSLLRVHATRSMGTAGKNPEVWGGVSARTADFSQNAFGSLHFQTEVSTSDGGIIWDGSQWLSSSWTILSVSPGTFTIEANVFGYATVSTTVFVSGTKDILISSSSLTKAANVFGWVILPSTVTQSFGTWVSVDGTKSGDNLPSLFGGAFLNVGASSGVYSLRGLSTTTYSLRAFAYGFQPATTSVIISGADIGTPQFDPGNPFGQPVSVSPAAGPQHFAPFSKGGSLTGLLTVNGNTMGQQGLVNGKFGLWLSAWNPTTYQGGSTEVRLTTNPATASASYEISGLADGTYNIFTFLQGFELDPPGVSAFTISSGAGAKNLTLQAFAGVCTGQINLGGATDFSNVTLSASGPGVQASTGPNASGAFIFNNLGSGYYQFTARYATNGFVKETSLPIINGKTVIWNPDLSGTPFTISGVVKTETSNPRWNPISNVLKNATTNDFTLGFPTTTARIEAIPRDPGNLGGEIMFAGLSASGGDGIDPKLVRMGVIDSTGNYTIKGLSPGLYVVRNIPDLDIAFDSSTPNSPFRDDVAEIRKVIVVSTNMTGVDFTLTDGFDISGTLLLPEGVADARLFDLNLKTPTGETLKNIRVLLGDPFGNIPSTAASYLFERVPNGNYILQLQDFGGFFGGGFQEPKYVAKPRPVAVAGASFSNQNIELLQGGKVIGRMRDVGPTSSVDDDILINSNNVTRLPDGFSIDAQPNPWNGIGGNRANEKNNTIDFDANGNFTIPALPAGTYDVQFITRGRDASSLGGGSVNYANVVKSGIVVEEGLTTDLGTVDLTQGLQIVGTVTDVETSAPVANIRIQAAPSSANSFDDSLFLKTFTDAQGKYTLTGADPNEKFYDITAAERFSPSDPRDVAGIELGQGYGEQTREAVDVTLGSAVDFKIQKAPGVVIGTVKTEDGGPLKNPFDRDGSPTANIIMHKRGTVPRKTPVGDIEANTTPDGTFKVNDLVAGGYDLRVFSGGYSVHLLENFEVSGSTSTKLSAITLKRGAILKGAIVKPDGSNPTQDEAGVLIAGSPDFKNIVVGSLTTDEITKVVTRYEIAGLQPGVEYAILAFPEDSDDAIVLAQGVSVSSTTETKVLNLIYKPSKPLLLPQARKVGGVIKVRITSTQSLRKRIPADDDLVGGDTDGGVIWLTAGSGAISNRAISSNRKNITFEYTPASGVASFKVRISSAYGSFLDSDRLAAGVSPELAQFAIDQEFEFFIGVANSKKGKVSNMKGGRVRPEGEVSGAEFPSGTFQLASSSSVEVEFSEIDGTPKSAQSPQFAAPAFAPNAYPAGIYKRLSSALKVLAQAPKVNPFSSFFELLLPKAISSSFGKEATLTLKYDASIGDPNSLNIYWFNEGAKVYLKQDAEKTIDLVNRTISVKVNHASLFVALNSNAPIISGDDYTGPLTVFNFPNPFDFTLKTVTLQKPPAGGNANLSIRGTMIRIAIPASLNSANASLKIYNVAGERVRTLDSVDEFANLKAGKFNYVEWDGKNDSGLDVASGVYVGELILGGQRKFFKMAVIK